MITYLQARDEIFAHMQAGWLAAYAAVIVTPAIVPEQTAFMGVEEADKPNAGKFWARLTQNTVRQPLASIGTNTSASQRRYRSEGFICIQVFAPKAVNGAYDKAVQLAEHMRVNQFTGSAGITPGRVVFQNARVDDTYKTSGQWYQVELWAEWLSDEVH